MLTSPYILCTSSFSMGGGKAHCLTYLSASRGLSGRNTFQYSLGIYFLNNNISTIRPLSFHLSGKALFKASSFCSRNFQFKNIHKAFCSFYLSSSLHKFIKEDILKVIKFKLSLTLMNRKRKSFSPSF